MSVLVADASPLIFLTKLGMLSLFGGVYPGRVLVPAAVHRELVRPSTPLAEARRLQDFLRTCRTVTVAAADFPGTALSQADREVLTLACRERPAVVLTDDALVRRIAQAEGLRVAGTLGTLIRARNCGLLPAEDAGRALEDLVARHGSRISVALYEEARQRLA